MDEYEKPASPPPGSLFPIVTDVVVIRRKSGFWRVVGVWSDSMPRDVPYHERLNLGGVPVAYAVVPHWWPWRLGAVRVPQKDIDEIL